MDFVTDTLFYGRRIRALAVIDLYTRESLAIEVDHSLSGQRVVRILDRFIEQKGVPEAITSDNGPEFTSIVMAKWAHENGIKLDFIRPGKPIENAYAESFMGRFRDECLNENVFVSLDDARKKVLDWREDYNFRRPHSSLNNMTPWEFYMLKTTEITNSKVLNKTGNVTTLKRVSGLTVVTKIYMLFC
jgi:putative transposase